MKNKRIEEIMAVMKSFSKDGYHKSELLGELFALQQEMVGITFNEEHAAIADLKIWDVEKHLQQLNEEVGHVADMELEKFMEDSKTLCNLIRAEISGNKGEFKVFKTLEYLQCQNRVLRNVELKDGETRTEIDALVISPKCLTIVEVKNTSKNIFIDEEGNYYRTGEFLKWDCNIEEKMETKERLLRKILESAGYGHLRIRSIVVFTNNRIEVQNKFAQIRTCFLSQLIHIIDGFRMDEIVSLEDMEKLQEIVEKAEIKEKYEFEFNIRQYQMDFANLLATLEFAKAKEEVNEETEMNVPVQSVENIHSFTEIMKAIISSRYLKYAGNAAALALTTLSGILVANTVNKGIMK